MRPSLPASRPRRPVRCATRRSPGWTGCTGRSRSAPATRSPFRPMPAPTSPRSSGALTARRTSSTGRPPPSIGSTSWTAPPSPSSGRGPRPPADAKGAGTTTIVRVQGSAEWGDDIRAVGTFLRDAEAGLYNFYVVDPSAQQILAYAPARDGGGFPVVPSNRLAHARPVDAVSDLFIDGDIWVVDGGEIVRFAGGREEGWSAEDPGDLVLRDAPVYERVTSGPIRREGRLYGWDRESARVIALRKSDGRYLEQYRLAGDSPDWRDVRRIP